VVFEIIIIMKKSATTAGQGVATPAKFNFRQTFQRLVFSVGAFHE